jgi:hypothetical protein
MTEPITRRQTLKTGFAAASLLALVPEWATPALAENEADVPFTDIPSTFNPNNPSAPVRMLDIRKIDGPLTPKDQFFAMQHMDRPQIDAAAYRLKFTGLVNKSHRVHAGRSAARCAPTELAAGYECSGNSPRAIGRRIVFVRTLRGRTDCSEVLKKVRAWVPRRARWSFFGADRGPQDVVFRQQTFIRWSSSSGGASRWRTR